MVINGFHRIQRELDVISKRIDNKLAGQVQTINSTLKDIASLNKQIRLLETVNGESGDLRDSRDLAVKKLSESFNIHTYRDNRNQFVVSAIGVGTLVSGLEYQELKAGTVHREKSSDNRDGSVEIWFSNGYGRSITNRFKGGEIASMAKVRNEDIVHLREVIDRIAFDFANTVNAIHRKGFVNRQVASDSNGRLAKRDGLGPLQGVEFF